MTDATTTFFQNLAESPHQAALDTMRGTIRFDLTESGRRTAHWLVTIDGGEVRVARRNAKADCVVGVDRTIFDGIASGELNALAAVLRGAMQVEGNRRLLLSFQRLFPAPIRRTS